ncbi:MAG: peptidoglycan-binding domain-containing protein [bacterium]|nr:peptidoglycan-binding domain-containing protein [bacterium]
MAMSKVRMGVFLFLVLASFIFAKIAFAAPPIFNSFTVNPQSISNNYSIALAWDIASSTGRDLYFNCPVGVTLKKTGSPSTGAATTGGSSFPCNTRTAASGSPADPDWAGFTVTNVSGATQSVGVTLYPRDSAGAKYDQGARTLSFSVQTSAQPIIDFSVSSTSIASGSQLTLTWKGIDASGVNVQFECADSVRIRTSASAIETLPCGKPALTQDLPISGSYSVYPTNSLRTPVSVTVRVFPEIGGKTYDATHSLSQNFTVLGTPAPASPTASEFTSTSTRLISNDSFNLSWTTRDAAGANIKFQCQEGLSVFTASSTTKLPCGTPAYASPLAAKGTVTLSVKNTNNYLVNLDAVLLPKDANGIYFQTTSLSLSLPVFPAGTRPTAAAQSPVTLPIPSSGSIANLAATTSPTSVAPLKSSASKYLFARLLKRGSRNADVTALQKILAQYPDMYPGGLVTGYFGPATEKAIGLFQVKFKIAKKGDAGYGTVGPMTRAKLNAMQ